MPIVDLILAVLLVGFLVNGYRRGFILTVGQIVGIVVGFVLARLWSPFVLARVTLLLPGHPALAYAGSFFLIFLVADRAVAFVFSIFHLVFKVLTIIPFLETINKILVPFLGLVAGVIFIAPTTYLLFTFPLNPRWMAWANQSQIALRSQALVLPVIQRFL